MKISDCHWKIPIALGIVLSSLVPVVLLCFIDAMDLKCSEWAYKHQALPTIAWTFRSSYLVGFVGSVAQFVGDFDRIFSGIKLF